MNETTILKQILTNNERYENKPKRVWHYNNLEKKEIIETYKCFLNIESKTPSEYHSLRSFNYKYRSLRELKTPSEYRLIDFIIDFILQFKDKIIVEHYYTKMYWYKISKNHNITLEDIKNNPNLPWSYQGLSSNSNITLEFVLQNLDKDWDWDYLTANYPVCKERDNYPDLPWNFVPELWSEPYQDIEPLNMDDVINSKINISTDLNEQHYVHHDDITLQFIEEHLSLPWNWRLISSKPNLTIDFILKYKYVCFNALFEASTPTGPLSKYKSTQAIHNGFLNDPQSAIYKYEQRHKSNKFDWFELSKNWSFSMEDIENHPELPWNYGGVSRNPNLTLDFVLRHPNLEWSYEDIASNLFLYDNSIFYRKISPYVEKKEKKLNKIINESIQVGGFTQDLKNIIEGYVKVAYR